jgi:hypothetical protein
MGQVIQLASAAVAHRSIPIREQHNPAIRTDAVYVVFTSIEEALTALRVAGDFAKALAAPVTLIHFRTVPYALPVNEPSGMSPVETDAFISRLRAEGVDVVAGQRSWWPTGSERWRRMLEAAGHFVVFVDTSGDKERSHA